MENNVNSILNQQAQPETTVITDVKSSSNKGLVIVILGVLIVLALIGGGVYLYSINQAKTDTTTPQQTGMIEDINTFQMELNTIDLIDPEADLQELDKDLQQL